MKEPVGMLERLGADRPTLVDLAFVDYQLGMSIDHSEIKVLRNLRARIVASTSRGGQP